MKNTKKTSLAEWETVINKNIPNTLIGAKFCLAVICQLLIKDIRNPFALVLVDVPSSAKTLTLNLFSDLDELVYPTDKFTPASFVSHSAKASNEELSLKVDLLPKIKNKTLIVRDMAPVFSDNPDKLQENLSILTRVLDGEGYKTESGVHGQRGYSGDYLFMMLAATTPMKNKTWNMMSSLGARMFFFNTRQPEPTDEDLVEQISTTSLPAKRNLCNEATTNLVRSIWNKYPNGIDWDSKKDDIQLKLNIAKAAKFLSKSRAIIEEDKTSKSFHFQAELPNRLIQLLYNFARGNAIANNRDYLDSTDVKQAMVIALESTFPKRSQVLRHLLENKGISDSNEIMLITDTTKPTALNLIRKLEKAELVKTYQKDNDRTAPMIVKLSETFVPLTNFFTTG